jgi:hypothetical protein
VLPSGREITLPPGSRPPGRPSLRPWAVLIAAIALIDVVALAVVSSDGDDEPAARTPTATSSAPLTASTAHSSPAPARTASGSAISPAPKEPARLVLSARTPKDCAVAGGSVLPPASGLCVWAGGAGPHAGAGTTAVLTEHDYGLRVGTRVVLAGQAWRVVSVRERDRAEGVDPAAFAGDGGQRRLYVITSGATSDRYARAVPAR